MHKYLLIVSMTESRTYCNRGEYKTSGTALYIHSYLEVGVDPGDENNVGTTIDSRRGKGIGNGRT